ncbi:Aspartyl-tRNA(Asn) amidotransferase subunit A @ Glutamyl-tRNA(Gln) amidotransferase subunit A [plant metagenome]|uniref:Aspartyl-tRNA(Asn) amidotransferase subunit A @ Glutamyl-tRNA(Gln) amidotransferase subunit A n=1 Tax=plant metagenome TaxID=1297885 RepID=A0A484TTK0_9ZZZZ
MNPQAENRIPSLSDAAAAIAAGKLTSTALVTQQLARIDAMDRKLHAYVDVYRDEALAVAASLDAMLEAGIRLGPLHGVTVAIKDLFDIAGKPIGAGSLARPPRRSALTATVVDRLRAAGAVVLGKTQTVEFAFGGWGTNAVMGTPWNPWDLETHRIPGGSSSGSSVAVAAGMACGALGTDTGGSVRIPAGLCGLVGLKTTGGLVSRHGLIQLCPTHDTVGPIAHRVRDVALLLDVIAGPDPQDAASVHSPVRSVSGQLDGDVSGTRVWILPESERQDIEPAVLAAYDGVLETLARLGMCLVERALPQSLSESMRIAGALMSAEGFAHLGDLFEQDLVFDPHVKRRILAGRDIPAAQYIGLLRLREQARLAMLAAMEPVDVCVMPTNAITAISVAEVDESMTTLSRFGRFVNLLDLCSVAVPAGFSHEGLPISVQFVGRPWHEPQVLRIARAFEDATRWYQVMPQGLEEAFVTNRPAAA